MTGRFDGTGFYHDPTDHRLLVPKRDPEMGWTINLSHRHGRLALLVVWAAAVVPLALGLLFAALIRY